MIPVERLVLEKDGDKATIDGIHDYMHELYRKKLLDEMVRLGWDEGLATYWIWKDWREVYEEEEVINGNK